MGMLQGIPRSSSTGRGRRFVSRTTLSVGGGGGTAVRLHDMVSRQHTTGCSCDSSNTGRPPADVLRQGAEELAERGGHCPSTALTLREGRDKTAERATSEVAHVRRVGGRGGSGQGKPGAELADMPEGRFEEVRSHTRPYGRLTVRLRSPEANPDGGGEGEGSGTVARGGAAGR